jgi:hypothetical protein
VSPQRRRRPQNIFLIQIDRVLELLEVDGIFKHTDIVLLVLSRSNMAEDEAKAGKFSLSERSFFAFQTIP